jgi:hypothetical protein
MSTFAARDKRCRNEWVVQAQGAAWSWAGTVNLGGGVAGMIGGSVG